MEPALKKAKITGHFRVALKPQDVNAQRTFKKLKVNQDIGKENIEVITINDDDDEDDDENHVLLKANASQQNSLTQHHHQPQQPQTQQPHLNNSNITVIGKSKVTVTNSTIAKLTNYATAIKLSSATSSSSNLFSSQNKKSHFKLTGGLGNNSSYSNDLLNSSSTKTTTFNTATTTTTTTSQTNKHTNDRQDIKVLSKSQPNKYIAPPGILSSIVDHDRSLLDDIRCEPYYAWDSFVYDREQEIKFKNTNYFDDGGLNHHITPHKRAELVDWLVQMQNIFELDHEPLYMAVKLTDQYLMKKVVNSENLQLLYMSSLLISAKFDERLTPLQISDLLQHSRSKFGIRYKGKQLLMQEVDILRTLNFNIRFPLSYGFLRRFARCTRSDKKTLTLARYILESSLLEYNMIDVLESKMAAGSLLLAFQMLHNDEDSWTETAKFYTGYEKEELYPLAKQLNQSIIRLSKKSAIRKKYSHEFFLEVAKIPPVCAFDR